MALDSTKMKIVADENIPLVEEVFSHLGDVSPVPGREISSKVIRDADILLVRSVTRVDRRLLSGCPVRFVATATTGIDHVDTEYLGSHEIAFAYAPGSNARSVAEYVCAALSHCAGLHSFNLEDMTLGIVGVGNIGSRVLRMGRILGMQTLCNDPPRARTEGPAGFVALDTLLRRADIVTLHVPLTREGTDATLRMVDGSFLGEIKRGAFLLNTSRGRVIDERALKKARGRLGGVVLDVWDNEPSIDAGLVPLTDCATPHIAGYSYDGKIEGTGMIYEAACRFLGAKPRWKPADHLDKLTTEWIDLPSRAPRPMEYSILQAYPIGRDDAGMRRMAALAPEERAPYFDALRRDYPRRLEFKHFSIGRGGHDGVNLADSVRERLGGLGFRLQ